MLILGIDPGSRVTGYGLVESRPGRLRAVAYGTIVPPPGLAFRDRLPRLFSALERLILRARPDCAAVEEVFHARNSKVALKLGHVRGVVLLALLRAGVPIHEYPPRLVKKAVGGYGAAEKEPLRRMVRLLLSLRGGSLPLDASDALAVAICHAHSVPAPALRHAARA
ncbi:MAG: crossover junction endodeoxyribonuclease RuvC [Acidobacteriota bacterium]